MDDPYVASLRQQMLDCADRVLKERPREAAVLALDIQRMRDSGIFDRLDGFTINEGMRIIALLATTRSDHPERSKELEAEVIARLDPGLG